MYPLWLIQSHIVHICCHAFCHNPRSSHQNNANHFHKHYQPSQDLHNSNFYHPAPTRLQHEGWFPKISSTNCSSMGCKTQHSRNKIPQKKTPQMRRVVAIETGLILHCAILSDKAALTMRIQPVCRHHIQCQSGPTWCKSADMEGNLTKIITCPMYSLAAFNYSTYT